MDHTTEIAIVGGGLAGLVAALALRRTGRSVALIAPPRAPDRRTTALLGESVATMKRLGLWPSLADAAQPLRGIRIVDATDRLIRAPEVLFRASEIGADAFGYNVPNETMLAALDEAIAAAGVLRIEAAATGVSHDHGAVTIKTPLGDLRTLLVVAADGRKSTIREAAGIGFEVSHNDDQAALVCNLRHAAPHDDISTEFHTPRGPFTLVPLPGRRSALVWVMDGSNAEQLRTLPADALAAEIERMARSFLGPMGLDGPAQAFPLMMADAERMTDRRIALIGEAAHVLPPIAAQGFNLTLRDVDALARLVESGPSDPGSDATLSAYSTDRKRDIGARKMAVNLLNRSLLSAFPAVQLVRSTGLFALSRLPVLRQALMRQGLGGL